MTLFFDSLLKGKAKLKRWLNITIQRLIKIAQKEVKKRKNGEKLSPFQIFKN
jgi:hypothetical protein